jgi:hypothetical protein
MNTFLETGISLVLLFFLFGIITYVIQELIAINLKYRSKMLWKSLEQLLDSKVLITGRINLMKALPVDKAPKTTAFYDHPQIACLQKDLDRKPSYIPAANFALAIMDLVAAKAPAKGNTYFATVQSGLQAYSDSGGKIAAVLRNLVDTSADIKELQQKIEDWYNQYMQRVTGWYESHSIVSVRLIALALTLIFNVNVIHLSKVIYQDGQIRSKLVSLAENMSDNPAAVTPYYAGAFDKLAESRKQFYTIQINEATSDSAKKAIQRSMDASLDTLASTYTEKQKQAARHLIDTLKSTGLPLGWTSYPFHCDYWKKMDPKHHWKINLLLTLLGWLIGAACISMGAPFWFDIMGKLVNVRRSGLKPDKSK